MEFDEIVFYLLQGKKVALKTWPESEYIIIRGSTLTTQGEIPVTVSLTAICSKQWEVRK